MDNNKVALLSLAGALLSFAVAALFQFVIHFGAPVVVTICAVTVMLLLSGLQGITRSISFGFRLILFLFSMFAALVFAGMFGLSWTMAVIYIATTVAANLIAAVLAP